MRTTLSKRRERGSESPPSDPPDQRRSGLWSAYPVVIALSLVALVALAAVYLFPYVTKNYRYPTGWDAPTAVLRARVVAASGIRDFGAIRSGVPLVMAVLMGATGRNAQTLVALLPAVLLWVAALGVVGLVRAAFDVRPIWLPVFAFLTWAAFGENGMLNLHLDNLLNASLVLTAFAAAASFIRWRRGAAATGLLLAAAAVAHWPFYAFALGIFLVALTLFVAASYPEGRAAVFESARSVAPLAGVAAGSAMVAAATFLARSQSGWVGARLVELRLQLRQRFLASLGQVRTYFPLPTAVLGAVAVFREAPAGRIPRRFFRCLMGAWLLVTVVGGLAQWAGLPTAGARELHYFFPLSIFTGLLVWWVARRLASGRTSMGMAAAGLVVLVAVGGFAALSVSLRSNDRPWFDRTAVKQTATASAYLASVGGQEPVVFIFEPRANRERPSWLVVQSTLAMDQLPRAYPYYGTIRDYQVGNRLRPNGRPQPAPPAAFGEGGAQPIALVLSRYAPVGYREASPAEPERVAAPGVLVLTGPAPGPSPIEVDPPIGDTRGSHLALSGLVAAMLLLVAGGGWSWALLPGDAVIRVALAPALGTGAVALIALGWAWVRLPLHGGWGAAPLMVAAVLGWALALILPAVRPEPASPSADPS